MTREQDRFRRFECKYVIPPRLATEITAFMRPYVALDPHAIASPDHSYDITSLYLDSPDLRLFQETRDGIANRVKLRLRTYAPDPQAPVFVEIKRRRDRVVLKSRARVTRGQARLVLDCRLNESLLSDRKARQCLAEFQSWITRWAATPVVWVRYRREAWVGTFHRDVRVTLDRKLACAPASALPLWRPDRSQWRNLESRRVILELKFDNSFPDWMGRLVHRFGLQRRSFSKYCNSIERGLDSWYLAAGEGPVRSTAEEVSRG